MYHLHYSVPYFIIDFDFRTSKKEISDNFHIQIKIKVNEKLDFLQVFRQGSVLGKLRRDYIIML